ncbi:MAG: ECF transporter S component [Eubacteriaceae bacterium]|nr:ECF transporter S component [Eubacteriaceae bacterium]
MKKNKAVRLALCALLAAVTIITTRVGFIVPFTNCYVHLGAAMVVLVAFLMPGHYGAAAVGIGMALSDLLGGFALWAPFTLVIRYFQAITLGSLASRKNRSSLIFAFVASGVVNVGGYYLAELAIYRNSIVAAYSAIAEVVLNIFGATTGSFAYRLLEKTKAIDYFN